MTFTTPQICITKGQARIFPEGLRCAAPRENDTGRLCHKLICKMNEYGQIAGNFRCERCGCTVEVKLKEPGPVKDTGPRPIRLEARCGPITPKPGDRAI